MNEKEIDVATLRINLFDTLFQPLLDPIGVTELGSEEHGFARELGAGDSFPDLCFVAIVSVVSNSLTNTIVQSLRAGNPRQVQPARSDPRFQGETNRLRTQVWESESALVVASSLWCPRTVLWLILQRATWWSDRQSDVEIRRQHRNCFFREL